jgi:hypothetical protein
MALRAPIALLAPLADTVGRLLDARDSIAPPRRANLNVLAGVLVRELRANGRADVVFVCTHNSRRSIFSQAWLAAAAAHFGLPLAAFSGGSQATRVAPAAIRALESLGFDVALVGGADAQNPRYDLRYLTSGAPLHLWSKRYGERPNPESGFIAVVNCSQADEGCPQIEGARSRLAVLYADPKIADGTPDEEKVYFTRAEQIGTEILSLVASCKELP